MPFDGNIAPHAALSDIDEAARTLSRHEDLGDEIAAARNVLIGARDILDGPFDGMTTPADFDNVLGALREVIQAREEVQELAATYPGNDFAPVLEALHVALERLCGSVAGLNNVSRTLARMVA